MSGGRERECDACKGEGLTEKEQHTVELDEDGGQVAVTHRFISSCTNCGGSGKAS